MNLKSFVSVVYALTESRDDVHVQKEQLFEMDLWLQHQIDIHESLYAQWIKVAEARFPNFVNECADYQEQKDRKKRLLEKVSTIINTPPKQPKPKAQLFGLGLPITEKQYKYVTGLYKGVRDNSNAKSIKRQCKDVSDTALNWLEAHWKAVNLDDIEIDKIEVTQHLNTIPTYEEFSKAIQVLKPLEIRSRVHYAYPRRNDSCECCSQGEPNLPEDYEYYNDSGKRIKVCFSEWQGHVQEVHYNSDGSGYLKGGGPCGDLYFDVNGDT